MKFFLKYSIFNTIFEIYNQISNKLKRKILLAFFLMTFAGFWDLLNVASLLPVLTSFSSPEEIYNIEIYKYLLDLFNIKNDQSIIYFTSITFVCIVIFSSTIRIFTLAVNARLSSQISSEISSKVYQKTLYQNYKYHLNEKTNEIISNIITGTDNISIVINAILRILTSSVNFVFVFLALTIVEPKISIFSLIVFGLIYSLIIFFVRKVLTEKSKKVYKAQIKIVKIIQESFGSIKDIILDNSQNFFFNEYRKLDYKKRKQEADITLLGVLPYSLIEAFALISIIFIGIFLSDSNRILPILGTLGLGLQRVLRNLQQSYSAFVTVQGRVISLFNLVKYLKLDVSKYKVRNNRNILDFKKSIRLNAVYFKYKDENILDNFNLEILKGEMIGITGKTGCGKSTLINIIMGLLEPTKGKVLIDDVDINKKENQTKKSEFYNSISHVSQDIYLSNLSFAENIAFGVPLSEINFDRVEQVAKEAHIYKFIKSKKNGFFTIVGERGIDLSGGQKQRIGLARALYKNSKVLILDEATSALDIKTESEVIKSINLRKNKFTIIMIAHRLSTLEQCNSIIKL